MKSTKNSDKEQRRKERQKKLRTIVFEISAIFPNLSLDTIAQAVLTTNGNKEKAIDILLQNLDSLQETPNTTKSKEKNNVAPQEKLVENAAEEKNTKQLSNPSMKSVNTKTDDEKNEKSPIHETSCKENPFNLPEKITSEQEVKIKRLLETFPDLLPEKILSVLKKCHWNANDAAAKLLQDELGEINIVNTPTEPVETNIEELVSDDSEYDDESEEEEFVEIEHDATIEEIIIQSTEDKDWYQEALKQQEMYFKAIKEQEEKDYKLALKLQALEYSKIVEKPKKKPNDKVSDAISTLFSHENFSDFETVSLPKQVEHQQLKKPDRPVKIHRQEKPKKSPKHTEHVHDKQKDSFDPEKFWSSWETLIRNKFPYPKSIIKIENIVNPSLMKRFCKKWQTPGAGVPVMTFHGTATYNVESIINRGLLVPGRNNGISVVNGSAYGVGIYLATNPSISMGYCRGDLPFTMFVCAALIGKTFCTASHGDIIVIFNEDQVLPCWLIKFKPPNYSPPTYVSPTANQNTNKKYVKKGQWTIKALKERKKQKKLRRKQRKDI